MKNQVTPNDAQIDILLRRYAQRAKLARVAEHLDADELNAFAEGTLPAATRSRYVSHLADCHDCRKIATQLISSFGAATVALAQPQETETTSWRHKLNRFFAPQKLRYAAFAVVLVAAAGVTFLALRHQPQQTLVAKNEAPGQTEVAVMQDQATASEGDKNPAAVAKGSPSLSQPRQPASSDLKLDQSKGAENAPAPPKPREVAPSNPTVAAERRAELPKREALPSFAPPPPAEAERAETRSRAQQSVGGIAGPRKDESSTNKFKTMEQARAGDVPTNRRVEENKTAVENQLAISGRRDVDEKAAASRRELDSVTAASRNTNESQMETLRKQPRAATGRADTEEAPETRAGGRKFRREGNAWIDTKFKSSMSVRNISRGSEEYGALDARIRSIAEQLGGEIIVVWKGKAYRIH